MVKKKAKRSRRSSSSSSSSSESTREKKKIRKLKKKLKKEKKKAEKLLKKSLKTEKQKTSKKRTETSVSDEGLGAKDTEETPADIPIALMERSKAMAPMTKEEWDKRQSVIRKVLDEETGRYRLIKGDGEVLEEIVSLSQHKQINKQATKADGEFFQSHTINQKH